MSHGQALDSSPMIAIDAAPTPISPSVASQPPWSAVPALAMTSAP